MTVRQLQFIFLLAAIALYALAGCVTTPQQVLKVACDRNYEYATERCAKAIADTYRVYQKRAEEFVLDPTRPEKLKRDVRSAEETATNVILDLLDATKAYVLIKQDLDALEKLMAAGDATPKEVGEKSKELQVASNDLDLWIENTEPHIQLLIKLLGS